MIADDIPEIAIVTVALNAAKDLPLTIESALGQSYPKLRLVVVDGASWDDSDMVLRRYEPFLDRLTVRPDAGIYFAMNAAIDEVAAEYVLFLNAGDQLWSEFTVARMVAELDGRPAIFYGDHVYVDRGREFYKRSADFGWLMARLERGEIDHPWHSAIPGHQATFTRAELLRELRFDTRLRIGADHELLFRTYAAGGRMQYIDECVAHYHGGGFSAQAGERTLLEGASIYRRFSKQPQKVDRLFFPTNSPFSAQTEMTGFSLGGFTRLESGPTASELAAQNYWVSRDGATLVSPNHPVEGIIMRGWNGIDAQGAELHAGDHHIASVAIPRASFRLNIAFDGPVNSGDIVTIIPRLTVPCANGEQAGFALQSFQFLSRDRPPDFVVNRGTEIRFCAEAWGYTQEMMGSGWSAAEDTHTWSLGPLCDLWLPIAPDARSVKLLVSGNPHVPEGIQRVVFDVNGCTVSEVSFHHGEKKLIELSCNHDVWLLGGNNNVSVHLHQSAIPPEGSGDLRDLGICLWALSVD